MAPPFIGHMLNIGPITRHVALLEPLNMVSNAFKHSFVNSDFSLIGRDEPCVFALGLDRNRIEAGVVFHNLSLSNLVSDLSGFYVDSVRWLKAFSERHR